MPAKFLSNIAFSEWKVEENPYSIFLSLLFILSILVIVYEASFLIKRIYRHAKAKKYGKSTNKMEESISLSSLKYSFSFLFIFFLFLLIPILKQNEGRTMQDHEGKQIPISQIPSEHSEKEDPKPVSVDREPIELYSYNDSVYALHNIKEERQSGNNETKMVEFPALFLLQKEKEAIQISKNYCIKLDFLEDKLIFLESVDDSSEYGKLRAVDKNGVICDLCIDDVIDFTCRDGNIYLKYRQQSIAGDQKLFGLYRANPDGSEPTLVAYPIHGKNFRLDFNNLDQLTIKDGYISNEKGKLKLGDPASGLEEVILNKEYKFDWIYYATNRLIKAKPNGSERIVLDELADYKKDGFDPYIDIDLIDDEWIYYTVSGIKYKIGKNGEEKTLIRE